MSQILIPVLIGAVVVLGIFALVAWLSSTSVALLIAFVLVALFMGLIILIQRPKGGGLSGAFGGAGGDQGAVFGSQVGDVLTWVTAAAFAAFVGIAVSLTYIIRAEVNPDAPAEVVNTGTSGTSSTGTDSGAGAEPDDSGSDDSGSNDSAPAGE